MVTPRYLVDDIIVIIELIGDHLLVTVRCSHLVTLNSFATHQPTHLVCLGYIMSSLHWICR